MVATTNALAVATAGVISLNPGATANFTVNWGSNISPLRWSRVWASVVSPGDADSAQSVAVVAESSTWNLSQPTLTTNLVTVRAQGQSGAPVVARLHVLASMVDTF